MQHTPFGYLESVIVLSLSLKSAVFDLIVFITLKLLGKKNTQKNRGKYKIPFSFCSITTLA